MAYNDLGLAADKIASIERTAGTGEAGSLDTYTITTASGDTFQFQVQNGMNGASGIVCRDFTSWVSLNTWLQQYAKYALAMFYIRTNASSSAEAPLVNTMDWWFNQLQNTYELTYKTTGADTVLADSNTTPTLSATNFVRVYIFDDTPASLDTSLDINSTNAVTNRAITGSLAKPAGVYDTLAQLASAYPSGNGNVYVVRADGKWYTWSGSAWVAGGDYKSLIDVVPESRTIAGIDLADDITKSELQTALDLVPNTRTIAGFNLQNDIEAQKLFERIPIDSVGKEKLENSLSKKLYSVNLFDKSKLVSGGYFGSDGSISPDASSQYSTQYIPVIYGKGYKLSHYGSTYCIATFNSTGDFLERITTTAGYITFGANVAFVMMSSYQFSFNPNFMMCEYLLYPDQYEDYNVRFDLKDSYEESTIKEGILNPSAQIQGIAKVKEVQNTLTSENIPNYCELVADYYVGGEGEAVYDSNYRSILIYAYKDFDIWFDSVTPANSYLSLALYTKYAWNKPSFVARYRVSNNNMPTSSSKLSVQKGQMIIVTYRSNNNNTFVFNTDGLASSLEFNDDLLLNIKQLSQVGAQIIEVGKSGDNYTINMGKYSFHFYKATDNSINLDSWDINEVYMGETLLESGNILGVIKESTQDDFMGGLAHGDEIYISMNIYCDGKPIASSTTGKKVDIFLLSNLKRVSDHTTNVVKRLVHIVFENNNMTIETTFRILVNNFSAEAAYIGMWGQYTSTISAIFNNIDVYDVSDYQSITSNELRTTTYVNNNNGLVSIDILNGYNYSSFRGKYVYYNDSLRLKNYFAIAWDDVLNGGDILYGKAIYSFE